MKTNILINQLKYQDIIDKFISEYKQHGIAYEINNKPFYITNNKITKEFIKVPFIIFSKECKLIILIHDCVDTSLYRKYILDKLIPFNFIKYDILFFKEYKEYNKEKHIIIV